MVNIINEYFDAYTFSWKYNAYLKLECNCGAAIFQSSYYDVVEAIKVEDTLEITVNYLKFVEDGDKWYVENNHNISVTLEETNNINEQWMNAYNKVVAQLNEEEILKYKFIFKKNNMEYYLESIEKIN